MIFIVLANVGGLLKSESSVSSLLIELCQKLTLASLFPGKSKTLYSRSPLDRYLNFIINNDISLE